MDIEIGLLKDKLDIVTTRLFCVNEEIFIKMKEANKFQQRREDIIKQIEKLEAENE